MGGPPVGHGDLGEEAGADGSIVLSHEGHTSYWHLSPSTSSLSLLFLLSMNWHLPAAFPPLNLGSCPSAYLQYPPYFITETIFKAPFKGPFFLETRSP